MLNVGSSGQRGRMRVTVCPLGVKYSRALMRCRYLLTGARRRLPRYSANTCHSFDSSRAIFAIRPMQCSGTPSPICVWDSRSRAARPNCSNGRVTGPVTAFSTRTAFRARSKSSDLRFICAHGSHRHKGRTIHERTEWRSTTRLAHDHCVREGSNGWSARPARSVSMSRSPPSQAAGN